MPEGDEVAGVNAYVCVCDGEISCMGVVCLLEGEEGVLELQPAGPETH